MPTPRSATAATAAHRLISTAPPSAVLAPRLHSDRHLPVWITPVRRSGPAPPRAGRGGRGLFDNRAVKAGGLEVRAKTPLAGLITLPAASRFGRSWSTGEVSDVQTYRDVAVRRAGTGV